MRMTRSLSLALVPCIGAIVVLVSVASAVSKEAVASHSAARPAAVGVMRPQSIDARRPDAGNGFIYATPLQGPVDVFPRDGTHQQPIGTITVPSPGSPWGCAVDKANDLYLTSAKYGVEFGPVLVYRPGQTTPYFAYRAPGLEPEAVAVGDDGTVHVVSFSQYLYDFRHGNSTLVRKVFLGRGFFPYGIAADRHGTVYVVSIQHFVLKVDPGAAHPDRLPLTGLTSPIAVAVDDAGNLVVADDVKNAIFIYPPGQTTPSQAITTGIHDPYDIALTPTKLFVTTANSQYGGRRVRIFDYPSGRLVNSVAVKGHDYYKVCMTSELP